MLYNKTEASLLLKIISFKQKKKRKLANECNLATQNFNRKKKKKKIIAKLHFLNNKKNNIPEAHNYPNLEKRQN